MGPSCRRRTIRSTKKSASTRKPLLKNEDKSLVSSSANQEKSLVSNSDLSSSKAADDDLQTEEISNNSASCSTPKSEKFRIPEIQTCPPAPKKRRILTSNCALRRTTANPIAFYASPDIELFFYFALRGIHV